MIWTSDFDYKADAKNDASAPIKMTKIAQWMSIRVMCHLIQKYKIILFTTNYKLVDKILCFLFVEFLTMSCSNHKCEW